MIQRLSYSNVIASIALFVALGGTGYAAVKIPKNSVGSKQLKKNAVTGAKIKNGSVALGDLKKGQVLTPGSAGSRFLEEADASKFLPLSAAGNFLPKTGKAADADKIDGINSTALVQGGGQRISFATGGFANPGGDTVTEFFVPDFGRIEFGCHGASYSILYQDNLLSGAASVWVRRQNQDALATATRDVGNATLAGPGSSNSPNDLVTEVSDVQIIKEGKTAALQIFSSHQRNATGSPVHAECSASLAGVVQ